MTWETITLVQSTMNKLAILRQTPEIQDMHRRWADWMRTTFEKLPDAPKEDLMSP